MVDLSKLQPGDIVSVSSRGSPPWPAHIANEKLLSLPNSIQLNSHSGISILSKIPKLSLQYKMNKKQEEDQVPVVLFGEDSLSYVGISQISSLSPEVCARFLAKHQSSKTFDQNIDSSLQKLSKILRDNSSNPPEIKVPKNHCFDLSSNNCNKNQDTETVYEEFSNVEIGESYSEDIILEKIEEGSNDEIISSLLSTTVSKTPVSGEKKNSRDISMGNEDKSNEYSDIPKILDDCPVVKVEETSDKELDILLTSPSNKTRTRMVFQIRKSSEKEKTITLQQIQDKQPVKMNHSIEGQTYDITGSQTSVENDPEMTVDIDPETKQSEKSKSTNTQLNEANLSGPKEREFDDANTSEKVAGSTDFDIDEAFYFYYDNSNEHERKYILGPEDVDADINRVLDEVSRSVKAEDDVIPEDTVQLLEELYNMRLEVTVSVIDQYKDHFTGKSSKFEQTVRKRYTKQFLAGLDEKNFFQKLKQQLREYRHSINQKKRAKIRGKTASHRAFGSKATLRDMASLLQLDVIIVGEIEQVVKQVASKLNILLYGKVVSIPQTKQDPTTLRTTTWIRKHPLIKNRLIGTLKRIFWGTFQFDGELIEAIVRRVARITGHYFNYFYARLYEDETGIPPQHVDAEFFWNAVNPMDQYNEGHCNIIAGNLERRRNAPRISLDNLLEIPSGSTKRPNTKKQVTKKMKVKSLKLVNNKNKEGEEVNRNSFKSIPKKLTLKLKQDPPRRKIGRPPKKKNLETNFSQKKVAKSNALSIKSSRPKAIPTSKDRMTEKPPKTNVEVSGNKVVLKMKPKTLRKIQKSNSKISSKPTKSDPTFFSGKKQNQKPRRRLGQKPQQNSPEVTQKNSKRIERQLKVGARGIIIPLGHKRKDIGRDCITGSKRRKLDKLKTSVENIRNQ
ncbi:hypothetical protein DASC09_053030 [Saccharomycopsis crataegensis]|uniref:PWWP domain-containing protein n=1 Tax=Saccharomycopsis crataegensis TaxID=43959 RepID=A0AAV5QV31_9ASCO|nr:hypothetical protein DASC09_053030 [Saccharomycopsis crataegensis]